MKNIVEILKGIGIEIPEEKKKDFNSAFNENYKTIKEVEKIQHDLDTSKTKLTDYEETIKKRDEGLSKLQTQLKDAGTTQEELDKVNEKITQLQGEYDTYKKNSEAKLQKQAYEFAVNQKVSGLKFSSNSAKKAFLNDILNDELKMKDGELIGFDDFVEAYKKTDADAFVQDGKQKPKINISGKAGKLDENEDIEENPEDIEKPRPSIW